MPVIQNYVHSWLENFVLSSQKIVLFLSSFLFLLLLFILVFNAVLILSSFIHLIYFSYFFSFPFHCFVLFFTHA